MNKKPTLEKGLKRLVILLGLLIAGPIVISLGFKALRVYTESPQKYAAFFITGLGVFLLLFAVYFGFKTFKTFLDFLFKK